MIRRLLFVAMATALLAPAVRADVKLHPLFSDGMVLQQGKECPIWGTADPDEKLVVSLSYKPKPNVTEGGGRGSHRRQGRQMDGSAGGRR